MVLVSGKVLQPATCVPDGQATMQIRLRREHACFLDPSLGCARRKRHGEPV
jgi:hypothetical protein